MPSASNSSLAPAVSALYQVPDPAQRSAALWPPDAMVDFCASVSAGIESTGVDASPLGPTVAASRSIAPGEPPGLGEPERDSAGPPDGDASCAPTAAGTPRVAIAIRTA